MGPYRRIIAALVMVLVLVQATPHVIHVWGSDGGGQEPSLYTGSLNMSLICGVNTGSLGGWSISHYGRPMNMIDEEVSFGEEMTVYMGDQSETITAPQGEYGDSLVAFGLGSSLSYPGTGARLTAVYDTGKNGSLTALRIRVLTHFDGAANGVVWYRVDLEWSDDQETWHGSTIFYNLSDTSENLDSGFETFFARGRYVRINITLLWTPDTGNTGNAHAFILVFIDSVITFCFPYEPQALIEYRVTSSGTNVTISLPQSYYEEADYAYTAVSVGFPVESQISMAEVNITANERVGEYYLTVVLDENLNPLPFKYDTGTGNLTVILPMVNQTIFIVYTRHGPSHGATWLPPPGIVWVFDFGDMAGAGDSQGWRSYGRYYRNDVAQDPTYNDYSLHTYLTNLVFVSSGGWYMRDLVLPPGSYYALVNLRVSYGFWSYYGRVQLMFLIREYDGTYRRYYLLDGRYTTYDGTVYGEVETQKWGNQVYLTVRSLYSYAGSQTWIRWAAIVGVLRNEYSYMVTENTTYFSSRTSSVYQPFYLVVPNGTGVEGEKLDTGGSLIYRVMYPGSGFSYFIPANSSPVNITVTAVSGAYAPALGEGLIIVPPSSTIRVTALIEYEHASAGGILDPPLAYEDVVFALVDDDGYPIDYSTATTNEDGYASATLATPPSAQRARLVVTAISWPYAIPFTWTVYIDSVLVHFDNQTIYMRKNSNETASFTARFNVSGIPFYGQIYLSTSSSYVSVSSPVETSVDGSGSALVSSDGRSGVYSIYATRAVLYGVEFPASGNVSIIVVGARVVVEPLVSGPPFYVYSNLSWSVYAVYDDGSPAYGTGYIVVEKDHYVVENITWDGAQRIVELDGAGYDNYVYAVLVEPTGLRSSNYSLLVAVQKVNVTSSGNVTVIGGNGSQAGVEFMSVNIETFQEAALKDALIVTAFIALTIAPLVFRRFTRLFRSDGEILLWVILMAAFTVAVMVGRSQIPTDAYIVQTPNGTTVQVVYSDNPFLHIYIAPLTIQASLIFLTALRIIRSALLGRRIGRW